MSVNGQPAKGTFSYNLRGINLRTAPNTGEAIADTIRNGFVEQTFEILRAHGTPIGTIMALGLNGGSAVPGAPLQVTQGNTAIVSGTGAFLGARGMTGALARPNPQGPPRQASMAEDPANRRRNGGGNVRYVLTVIPMFVPQIVTTSSGPAVFHCGPLARHRGKARQGRRGTRRASHGPRPDPPWHRPRAALSIGCWARGQFTGGGVGERTIGGSDQQNWMAGARGHVSR